MLDAAGRWQSAPAGRLRRIIESIHSAENSDFCALASATTKASHRYATQTQQHDAARFGHNVERDVIEHHFADASGGVGLVKHLEKQSTAEIGGGRVRLVARVYVYSVLRRLAEAEWNYFADCPISESWISRTAVELCDDWKRADIVEQMDNSISGTKGDPWIRFGSRQKESDAFKFVEEAVKRDSIGERLASAPSQTSRQSSQRKSDYGQAQKSDGCLPVLITLFMAAVFSIAWIVSIRS